MKRILIIALLGTIGLISCDNRKDVIADLQKDANKAPTISIRRLNSSLDYQTTFSDTALPSSTGYRLQYIIQDENIDKNSLKITCTSNCSNVTYTIKADSSLIVIFAPSGGTYTFDVTVSDIYGLKAIAYLKLVTQNKKPLITIKSNSLSGGFSTLVMDSIKTLITPLYSLSYNIDDDNSSVSGITVLKKTSGDNSTVTVSSSGIDFNFTTAASNKLYKYAIYLTDQLSKVSDTAFFEIYVFKNRPPVIGDFTLATISSTTEAQNGSYLTKYYASSQPSPYYVYKSVVSVPAYDKDFNYNGFISKIKWKIETYMNVSNAGVQYFNETFTTIHANTDGPTYSLTYYMPWPKSVFYWPAFYQNQYSENITATVFDNDGDSTVYSRRVTF